MQPAEHEHNSVQQRLAFTHLQRPVHPFLHPHFKSCVQETDADERLLHFGFQYPSTLDQPKRSGEGMSCLAFKQLDQIPFGKQLDFYVREGLPETSE